MAEEGVSARKTPGFLWKDILKIVLASCFFAGVALLLQNDSLRLHLMGLPMLRDGFAQKGFPAIGWRQALVFVATCSLLIGGGLPRLWVSAISGAIFGPLEGTLLALTSSLAGAALVYKLGETLLSGILRRWMGPRLASWQRRFERNAFWWVLYLRLFPLSNATLASLVCGVSRIPWRAYLAGSLIGFLPLTVVFVVFGSGSADGNFFQIAVGGAFLAAAVVGRRLLVRLAPALEKDRDSRTPPPLVTRSKDEQAPVSKTGGLKKRRAKPGRYSTPLWFAVGTGGLLVVTAVWFWFQPNSGTLADVVRTGSFRIAEIPKNLSGITYSPASKTLFMVSNTPTRIYEVTPAGRLVRQIDLAGFNDTEDIVYIEAQMFAVVEEKRGTIVIFQIFPETRTARYADCRTIQALPPEGSNLGGEGLAWDPDTRTFLISRETHPRAVFTIPFDDAENARELPELHNLAWPKLGDYAGLYFDRRSRRLLILSRTSGKVRDFSLAGKEHGSLNLHRLIPGIIRAEGLSMAPDGVLYVCSEPNMVDIFAGGKGW